MASVFGDQSSLSHPVEIETLKSIIHNLSDGVVVADLSGKFIFFNRVAESILGIGAEDVPLQDWSDTYGCYLPDGRTPFPPEELPLAKALTGQRVDETEIFIRNAERPDGVHILVKATPLWNEANKLAGGIVLIQDISRKKEIEAKIGTLTNAVEQTADTIVITNRTGRIEYVNPAFEQTTGYTRAEALGNTPAILKSGVHNDAFYKNLWETVSSGRVFRATIANRKKSGEIYFAEQTITPMRDTAGHITHYVSVVKDVTEQRKLQEQEAQMKVARSVQQTFYRVSPPQVAGFDIAGAAFPADATGGDYFDFVPLQQGFIGLALGDICGHGIGSALLMVELRSCLRAFATKSTDVAEIITLLNGALVSDLLLDRFATLIFCRLHPESRTMVYANAGHFPGYILDATGAVKRTLDSREIPLGMFSGRAFTCSEDIQLEQGDVLALLTDGILEAERPDETQFGAERALEFIRAHRHESAQQIIEGLYRAVRNFSDGLPQTDDITAVICKSI
jgi:phosphoserine phosphatase RsbU/P